jgi:predicted nucleotidyltransferase
MTTTGVRIRQARTKAGLTQAELATRTRVHQPSVSAYERGVSEPRPETLQRLLDAMKVRPSFILERHRLPVLAAAAAHRASKVRVFGSAVHGTDTPESDIDLLIHLDSGSTLVDLVAFADECETILGCPVDVVSDDALVGAIGRRITAEAVPL